MMSYPSTCAGTEDKPSAIKLDAVDKLAEANVKELPRCEGGTALGLD